MRIYISPFNARDKKKKIEKQGIYLFRCRTHTDLIRQTEKRYYMRQQKDRQKIHEYVVAAHRCVASRTRLDAQRER
jgi:hypothetical protein